MMSRTRQLLLIGTPILLIFARTAGADDVRLQIRDGLVWLAATNTTVAKVLAEWGRVGGTEIVNSDRVPDTRVTLQLDGVPEQQALDMLLRSAGGFVASRRSAAAAGASAFGRVVILPKGAAPAAAPLTVEAPTTAQAPSAELVERMQAIAAMPGAVKPVLGADGNPLEDDQADAPVNIGQRPVRPQPVGSMPPGFAEPPQTGPSVITSPTAAPRKPGGVR